MDISAFKARMATASPLEVPYLLMQLEQYDCETAMELFDRINREFDKEDLMNNVLTPVTTTIIDSLLMLPVFKGITRKLGLSANRIMVECQSFNYDGSILYLQPDSFVEKSNQDSINSAWGENHRPNYERSKYENTSKMGRYKKEVVEKAGGKKNLTDEYTGENNITEKKSNPDFRRNDPKNDYNAETDHIVPLKKIFEQVQNNMGLSDRDIENIANADDNLAVTARRINNPKRDMTNSEFIELQDRLKAEGKQYVELSPTQRENMIRMEREAQSKLEDGINHTVVKNLFGNGKADRNERKAAIQHKEAELGRKLTEQERKDVDKKLGFEKAARIHKENIKSSGKQTLMYALGSTILFLIKPVYYELKDSFINGFKEGVGATSFKEAFSIRFGRVKDYVWLQLTDIKHMLGSAMDIIKNLLSSIIEGIIGMFVGIFKKAFRIVKECIKIFVQSFSVLFGEASKHSSAAEKGDAILKIFGASATALCGIWIDSMLENLQFIPEEFRGIISTFFSGIASILIFYLLDKADLFNVKAERRNLRIKEIFDERIKDIREATESMNESVIATLKAHALESRNILVRFSEAFGSGDFEVANNESIAYANFMNVDLGYNSLNEFKEKRSKGTITWKM